MNRFAALLLSVTLMLFALNDVIGKEFPMLHFTKDDGLPSNIVYHIYRDHNGYLWIATDKGLARYNGIRFEKFTTLDGLADNIIFSVQEDYEGRIWFATFNGKLCFYKDGVFYNEANTPFLKMPFSSPHINNILLNDDSSLTFHFSDHAILLNIHKDAHSIFFFKEANEKYLRWCMYARKISKNRYELIYDSVVVGVDTTGKIIDTKKMSGVNKLVCFPAQDNFYFIDNRFVYSKDLKPLKKFKTDYFEKYFINAYFQDGPDMFIGTNKGLFVNDSLQILDKERISSITKDKLGNYWIGTLKSGIY